MGTDRNKYGLSRRINTVTKRQVRQECGYGCVVCGSAIYQYHHFDPPFVEAHEHDPAKIALLCGMHHDMTHGFLSEESVAEARLNPFCKERGFAHAQLDVSDNYQFTIAVGKSEFIGLESIIEINGETILSLHPPEAPGAPPTISARFFDRSGAEVASIVRNEWRGSSQAFDIEARLGEQGGTFKIRSDMRNIDLVVDMIPPNLLAIKRIELFFQGVRISGDETEGFSVSLANGSAVKLPNDQEQFSQAPFWINVQDNRILLGRDRAGFYSKDGSPLVEVPGYIEVESAKVEFEDSTLPDHVLPPEARRQNRKMLKVTALGPGESGISIALEPPTTPKPTFRQKERGMFGRKVGRNEPCPCGSGVKYKLCHGRRS